MTTALFSVVCLAGAYFLFVAVKRALFRWQVLHRPRSAYQAPVKKGSDAPEFIVAKVSDFKFPVTAPSSNSKARSGRGVDSVAVESTEWIDKELEGL